MEPTELNPLTGLTPAQIDALRMQAVEASITASGLETMLKEQKTLSDRRRKLDGEVTILRQRRVNLDAQVRTAIVQLQEAGVTSARLVELTKRDASWLAKLRREASGEPAKRRARKVGKKHAQPVSVGLPETQAATPPAPTTDPIFTLEV